MEDEQNENEGKQCLHVKSTSTSWKKQVTQDDGTLKEACVEETCSVKSFLRRKNLSVERSWREVDPKHCKKGVFADGQLEDEACQETEWWSAIKEETWRHKSAKEKYGNNRARDYNGNVNCPSQEGGFQRNWSFDRNDRYYREGYGPASNRCRLYDQGRPTPITAEDGEGGQIAEGGRFPGKFHGSDVIVAAEKKLQVSTWVIHTKGSTVWAQGQPLEHVAS